MVVDFLKVIILVVIGTLSAITDIKIGIVSNKIILPALMCGIILDIAQYIVMSRQFLGIFIFNVVTVFLIGFLLYATRVWAGGDTKLLCVIALFIPVDCYWSMGYSTFPLAYLISLMFIAGFAYLIVDSIMMTHKEHQNLRYVQLKNEFVRSIKQYAKTIVLIACMAHLYLSFIRPFVEIPSEIFMVLCVALVWAANKIQLFSSRITVIGFVVFDILMTVFTGILTINTFWWTYLTTIVLMLLRIFVSKYNYETIPTSTVSEGMVLSSETVALFQQSRVKGLPVFSDETLRSRITSHEAASIRRWENSKYGSNTVVIVRKIPFAIFMFIGTLLYLMIGMIML